MRLRRCRCGAYLFIRSFHTLLVTGVTTTLIVKQTDLSRALHTWPAYESIVYSVGFFSVLILSLTMYFISCYVAPGFVPIKNKKHVWDSDEEEELVNENTTMLRDPEEVVSSDDRTSHNTGATVKLRRCGFCEIEQPLRSHHCEDCGRCVRRYDHHCPWLETCVGERNHKFFWIFLVSTSVLVLWAAVIVWNAFVQHAHWSEWFRTNALFILDCGILLSAGITVIGLTCFHTYLMCSNQTTWEVVSRERITYLKNLRDDLNPFHEGYCKNMYTFLCAMGAKKWDVLYRKYTTYRTAES